MIICDANGAKSDFVLTMDASEGADGLVATEDIKSLDDLAGKKVALDKSASSYYFLRILFFCAILF